VVREGEQLQAKETGRFSDKLVLLYNNTVNIAKTGGGRKLSIGQKNDFFEAAVALWEASARVQIEREDSYQELGDALQISPAEKLIKRDLIGDMRNIDPRQIDREGGPLTSDRERGGLSASDLRLKPVEGKISAEPTTQPNVKPLATDDDIRAIEQSLGTTNPTAVIEELRKNFRLNE